MTTQVDNANRALAEIGTRSRLTVIDDSTTVGLYVGLLYPMLLKSMLRMGDYDWSMEQVPAVAIPPSTATAWAFHYAYPEPDHCIRIRQAVPLTPDLFDPVPAEWNIYFDPIPLNRIVVSRAALASFIITRDDASEEIWDSQFTDAFVRYLASALTMALENRMEASETVLKNALTFAGLANMRDD